MKTWQPLHPSHPLIFLSAQAGVPVRLCVLRRQDGSIQLACAHRDVVLLSGTYPSLIELQQTVRACGVASAEALSTMFSGVMELSRRQLDRLGFHLI